MFRETESPPALLLSEQGMSHERIVSFTSSPCRDVVEPRDLGYMWPIAEVPVMSDFGMQQTAAQRRLIAPVPSLPAPSPAVGRDHVKNGDWEWARAYFGNSLSRI